MPRRRSTLFLVFLTLTAALVACGRAPTPPAQAALEYEATATSATSVRVVFSAAVDDASQIAGNYAIAHAGGPVQVFSAQRTANPTTVLLATAPLQDSVTYTLDVHGVGAAQGGALSTSAATFGGSAVDAPIVASAISLSSTEVLVHFIEAPGTGTEMSDSALELRYYAIVDDTPTTGATPDLGVTSIAFAVDERGGIDRTRVILTTEEQLDTTYTLRVTNVLTQQGDKVLDPTNNTAAFRGMPDDDTTRPSVRGATAISNTEVLVEFSEPVAGADDADRYAIADGASRALEVTAAAYANAPYNTRVRLTTAPQRDDLTTYTVTVTGVADRQGNPIDTAASSAAFNGVSRNGPIDGDTTAPRVANTGSTNNSTVLVTFTEPIEQTSAEDSTHYRISANLDGAIGPNATLQVLTAVLSTNRTTVTLTTMAQSDLLYTLAVTNVTDLAGNQIAPPERLVDPSTVTFQGTPPSGPQADSDGDGLSDAAEQAGWYVTVQNVDGSSRRYQVTSNPGDPTLDVNDDVNDAARDTDGDGLDDLDERIYLTDPRSADTDGDGISDDEELNVYYSEPNQQDTDGDGLIDGLEVESFRTSPLLADTDGDQFDDGTEVTTDNRNPRVADLPRVAINVGAVDLRLDVRFEEQTSSGTRTLDSRSFASTLSQSQESAQARETSSTLEWFVQGEATVCTYGGCEDGKEGGFAFTASGGASGSSSTTFSTASVRATQREYATSLASEAEITAESIVTRVVEGATMAVEVSLRNASNIAFTISDIEITARVQDPRDPSAFVPVATLFAASGAPISIGPLDPERGPFRFATENAFPSLVESLMANPRGLTFEIASYTIIDEFGRDFAFVEQDVNDRTAYLEINYAGNAPLERLQVATNGTFDAFGDPSGVTFAQIMEDVLGLAYVDEATDGTLDPRDRADADLLDASYSTRTVNGVDTLWRVKRVSRELTGSERDWWVLGPQGNITPVGTRPGVDFRTSRVFSDQDFAFAFVQDLDQDDLEAIEEGFYRSLDSAADVDPTDGVPDSRDTDRDGIDDADEVYGRFEGNRRVRWTIRLEDGRDAYTTMAHPGRIDTDGDGLTDCQELAIDTRAPSGMPDCLPVYVFMTADNVPTIEPFSPDGEANREHLIVILDAPTDPSNPDTDGDGLTDLQEAIGFEYVDLTGARAIVTASSNLETPYATNPLARDTDRDGLDDRAEALLGSNPIEPDGDTVRDDDADGLVNRAETIGWTVTYRNGSGVVVDRATTSDPARFDTDGDGLTDWEEYRGCRDADRDFACDDDRRWGPTDPSRPDTDGDGIRDRIEVDGVPFPSDTADPLRFTDPLNADSDGDGRSDGDEVDVSWLVTVAGRGGYVVYSDPLRRDADGDGLNDADELAIGTDPGLADSDGDGALDGLENSRETDPLVPDHLVTVTYLGLQAGKGGNASADGDEGANPGDFDFRFRVRAPTASGSLQLYDLATPDTVTVDGCPDSDAFLCRGNIEGVNIIQIGAPQKLHMSESMTFSVPYTSTFFVEGYVYELDPQDGVARCETCYSFGGIGDPNGVYAGVDLRKGTFTIAFNSSPRPEVPLEVTVLVTVE